jgi:hypothetical protein
MSATVIEHDYERFMRFTSSQVHRLVGFARTKGAREQDVPSEAFYTYADEIYFQRKMGRKLQTASYSRSMSWGKFMERVAFESGIGLETRSQGNRTP